MNLLVHLNPDDWDAWKDRFDGDYEDRMSAGLTTLQIWRGVDGGGVTVLLDCNDRARAEAWLDRERATGHAMDARFLVVA